MLRTIPVAILLASTGVVVAQATAVDAHLSATTGASLSIKQVLPDSFPEVRVIFRAGSKAGQPIWDLRREQLTVLENGRPCATTCLYPITSPLPLNIALVIDHSGSMAFDAAHPQETHWESIRPDSLGVWHVPPGYVMPMDHARNAVLSFVDGFDTDRDALALIGFSTTVDVREPLTRDVDRVRRKVSRMRPTEWTALYDAVIAGVREVRDAGGYKAVVVLTDGQDNSSRNGLKRAIREANADNVLVFTIGLGDVDRRSLTRLAEGTGAVAHFTTSPSSLPGIYAEIGRSIRAYYSLTYRSVHFAEADTTREVEVVLDFSGMELRDTVTGLVPWRLLQPYRPTEALVEAVIEQVPQERDLSWPVGIGTVVLLGGTALVLRYRRSKKGPQRVLQVWPVPTTGELFVDLPAAAGTAVFTNAQGAVVKRSRLAGGVNHFDLSQMPTGTYTLCITPIGEPTDRRQLLIVH